MRSLKALLVGAIVVGGLAMLRAQAYGLDLFWWLRR
jgi:hypothetical protein